MTRPRCKPKPCRVCGETFKPHNSLQVTCKIPCAIEYTRTKQEKARRRQEKAAEAAKRKDSTMRRENLRTRSDWLSLAQIMFNKWIRLRDKDEPCISCKRHHTGQYHAGHYRSIGAAPELRFTENNVHKQCAPCNNHKSGNAIEYRINLVDRCGLDTVEELEGPHEPLRLSIEEIKEIRTKYRLLAKQLEKDNGPTTTS